MAIQLRWLTSHSASCFHAVAAIRAGQVFADLAWQAALAEPADCLIQELEQFNLPIDHFLEHLVPQSAGIDNNRQLAQVVCQKVHGSVAETTLQRLAGCFESIEAAGRRAMPKMVEELRLRIGPLREQWEARGPGLLKRFGELSDPRLLVECAEVCVVQPALGGAGVAHLPYNSLRIEGLLVHPLPALPEVVRMAWLLAQLQCDLPVFAEQIARDRLAFVAGLAVLPAVLAAAEYVELCRAERSTLTLALQAWHLREAVDAQLLLDWWETYQGTKPEWPVALSALDQLIGEPG